MTIPSLNIPVAEVRGVGQKRSALLRSAGIETVSDLLLRIPRRHIDRRTMAPAADLPAGTETTVVGTVVSAGVVPGKRPRFIVTLHDGSGRVDCVWFGGVKFLHRAFQKGDVVAVGGKVERFGGRPQMVHPEFEILASEEDEDRLHTGRVIPLYPTTAEMKEGGLDSRGLRRAVRAALDAFLGEVTDPLPERVRTQAGLMPLPDALKQAHFPETLADAERARERLAFDELLLMQVVLARARQRRATEPGIAFSGSEALTGPLLASLPYALTRAQQRAFSEIVADMRRSHPMNRLLQGDVGSGKTVVALLAALVAVADGYQAAIMAPTEILAEQHLSNLRALASALGTPVRLLVGRMPAAERRRVSAEIASGEASIVVGTHALLSEDVRFRRLGLVVIDEQHRFGVFQRAGLRGKGVTPDTLVMTATPIPRTLTLTLYGDLEVSVLDELPPGRTPVRTAWRTADRRPAILQFVRDEVGKGRQAYLVYPLVEASEKSDMKAATEAFEALRSGPLSGLRLALLHGQMKGAPKEAAMSAFQRGEVDALVSTTVIEVGVDVPNASVMVVEHAERFGLPQLHQLRGRVGRGAHASTCILIADPTGDVPLSEEARARLEALVRTNDGFEVAEIDLRLRGPGDLFGARQSGLPDLRIAHPVRDARLLNEARQAASQLIGADPDLSAPEHRLLREMVDWQQGKRVDLVGVG